MKEIEDILNALKDGKISVAAARKKLSNVSIADLTHTRIDLDRHARTGAGEVIFGAGKTPAQIVEIMSALRAKKIDVLATRLSDDAMGEIEKTFSDAEMFRIPRIAALRSSKALRKKPAGKIAIVSAGTSDMRVAEEARVSAEFFGDKVECFYDCGVAGLHRLTSQIDKIRRARVVIAVAGMEGALASVLAGLVKCPVIALPTSVGYGASFGGLAALLAMLNSCANGVSVVNIDNGFGAAYNAHIINSI